MLFHHVLCPKQRKSSRWTFKSCFPAETAPPTPGHELHAFVINYNVEPIPSERQLQVQGLHPRPLSKPSRIDRHELCDPGTEPDWLEFAISEDASF